MPFWKYFCCSENQINQIGGVVMMGPDEDGKAAVLHTLISEGKVARYQTFQFESTSASESGSKFRHIEVMDVGRKFCWRFCPPETGEMSGIVFVIDGSKAYTDQEREDFKTIVNDEDPKMCSLPIMILVNGSNSEDLHVISNVSQYLELHSIKNRVWHIAEFSAQTGEGVKEAFKMLKRMIIFN